MTIEFIDFTQVAVDQTFCHRERPENAAHLASLIKTLRNIGNLDPILVWDMSQNGKRFTLLDGRHRLGAYRAEYYATRRPDRFIPAIVIRGNRCDADIAALSSNSKECLPLTPRERLNAAWTLVRRHRKKISKKALSKASGVSVPTVSRMRRVLAQFDLAEAIPEGNWLVDRNFGREVNWSPPSSEEQEQKILALSQSIKDSLNANRPLRIEDIAEALSRSFPNHHLQQMVDYLGLGPDDTWAMSDDEFEGDDFECTAHTADF